MALTDFFPPLKASLPDPWDLWATQNARSVKQGDEVTVVLTEQPTTGDAIPRCIEKVLLTNSATRAPCVAKIAAITGLDAASIDTAMMQIYGQVIAAMQKRKPTAPGEPYYTEDTQGLWLVSPHDEGEQRTQLTNFTAKILTDIVEDDGTTTTPRFFEVEASQGAATGTMRVPAKDFQLMHWVPEALGAQARVLPGPYQKEHAHGAIQDLSTDIEHRHTYTHTGWRFIDDEWCYLHNAGAITATGLRKDLCVALGEKFARYRLPAPPDGPDRIAAIRKSLALRTLGPGNLMALVLPYTYLAPLRQLLHKEPPDFTGWIVGKTGHFKSEYVALALAHFGDFSRLTLPATFESTGNGLERLLHTPKDSLLVIDDYFPANTRRQAEAMDQVAARLLRGMGNQAARQRMRRDTTMQDDLPPRCVALATAERLPDGHSSSARMFLISVPPMTTTELQAIGATLSTPQKDAQQYPQAMAAYLQWIAARWAELETSLLSQLHAFRTQAHQVGCHAREPGQVAYLQLAWDAFTQCAVEAGAMTEKERTSLLQETWDMLLGASREHSALLASENTVTRFMGYLHAGLASKQLYLRDTDDNVPTDPSAWGWTPTTTYDPSTKTYAPDYAPGHALLLGYVDDAYLYLIPKTLEQYLHQAAREEDRPWPVDATTLLRELDSAGVIETREESGGKRRREVQKKINKINSRYIWLKKDAVQDEEGDDPIPF